MADVAVAAPRRLLGSGLAVLLLLSALLAFALARLGLGASPVQWSRLFASAQAGDMAAAITAYAALPRIAVALLAGSMLAFAGVLFQVVLRNPLAEPTTLGVSAGAQLALALGALYAPWLMENGREWVSLTGSAVAVGIVALLTRRQAFSPISLILAGLVIGLASGAASGLLEVLNRDYLQSIAIWSTGQLDQNGWAQASFLASRFTVLGLGASLLARPLALLALGDEAARGLGLRLAASRFLILAIASALSACVVSAVGVIGFVGLAAPVLARGIGARSLAAQMCLAPALGATLLLAADQSVQLLASPGLSAGTVTALLGAPLLLWMLRTRLPEPLAPFASHGEGRVRHPWRLLFILLIALILAVAAALGLKGGPGGFGLETGRTLGLMLPWRWPRVLEALSAGALLAGAGTILQRLTGNPLASPEVLGVAPAAGLGAILLMLVAPDADASLRQLAGVAGASVALGGLLFFARAAAATAHRMLLVGVAIGTVFSALVTALAASGDPRLDGLLSWMAGSTLDATPQAAGVTVAAALCALALAPLVRRWLAILPLGPSTAQGLGLPLGGARLCLLLLAAGMTSVATLAVGPFSFVGLMAPHMARMLGLSTPLAQVSGAMLMGAGIMTFADTLGRLVFFPYELPAGLIAACIGAPYLLLALTRQPQGG